MNKEEKDLLLKDLCARLQYKVMLCIEDVADKYNDIFFGISFNHGGCLYINGLCVDNNVYDTYATIKPYLFPLSSMTDEQKEELLDKGLAYYHRFDREKEPSFFYSWGIGLIDWLNAHHFDYRGLIEKGLAIDATKLNVYQ